ncbi:DEAD/DEAH box helicase [Smaragdicoccus niigatensis]|uniref:DEAD/DEAH box helicase n=1 Tax=Smaragdicoccus niigatensis TaxID=359359 RepID=UPI001FE1BBF8|nr:DEAD/DEAH box helicase [Smaragdicoccus niigatensis]
MVNDFRAKCLEVYKQDPNRVEEDAGKERGIAEGGYGRKQAQELVQNAADALRGAPGRVEVVLTGDCLYVANEGKPFVDTGVRALLYTHLSNKVGGEIGRFGLGFKSISGVSDKPQIFSQSVSFEFSRDETVSELSAALGRAYSASEVPALRLAWVLDAETEMRTDAVLASLSAWAVTIVKIPLLPNAVAALSQEIAEFDESFNLFAPHVRELALRDETVGKTRKFSSKKSGNRIALTTDEGEREWLVFSRPHKPSPAALESAGHSARRDAVEITWAVPKTGNRVGQMAAYFPVQSDLTLSGRVNAPWKLSDDRINVIPCEFNRELLADVLPMLVVEARKDLVSELGPARYIDVLPARGKEVRSWADGVINEPIFAALRDARCLPDLDGDLRSPASVQRVPNKLVAEFTEMWMRHTGNRDKWVHPDCTNNDERRSKVERLMQGSGQQTGRVLDWLQSIVAVAKPENSAAAVEIASMLQYTAGVSDAARMDVRDSRIVLLESGKLERPIRGRCFIRSNKAQQGEAFVHSIVTKSESTRSALESLGITQFEQGGEMLQLLTQLAHGEKVDWTELWTAMRGSGAAAVEEGFDKTLAGKAEMIVHVLRADGKWVLPTDLYLPGELRALKEDAHYLVDASFHGVDADILALLGVRTRPGRLRKGNRESWIGPYVKFVRAELGDYLKLGVQSRENLQIDGLGSVLNPLEFLPSLSATNRVALTLAVLKQIDEPRVSVRHPQVHKPIKAVSPEVWWLRQHGLLPTTQGAFPIQLTFVPSAAATYEGLLPTLVDVELSDELTARLGLRKTIDELGADEYPRLVDAHVQRKDRDMVALAYCWWCEASAEPPPAIRVLLGGEWRDVEPTQVAIAKDEEAQAEFDAFGIPSMLAYDPADVFNLRERWGCIDGSDLPFTFSYETSAELVCLVDAFDIFDEVELDDDPETIFVQKCLSISKVAAVPGRAELRTDAKFAREGNTILVTGESDFLLLKQILLGLGADSSDEQVRAFLSALDAKRNSKFMRELRQAPSDEARLLALAGENRLKSLIPQDALDYLRHSSARVPAGLDLAKLVVTTLGVRALERACKVDPHTLPVSPPSTWNGSFNTRKWAAEIGFSEEWAGQRAKQRNKPAEYIDGPTELAPLHDYQQAVSDRLRALLRGEGKHNRGIISLPTGAGKTRVAVESIIRAVADGDLDRDHEFRGPILWLADGEELCEQAIDAWSFLWRAAGRRDTQLVLSRFWANYDVEEETSGVQVVVANWQKVVRAVDSTEYAWLSESPLVIIDEAHGAYSPSYTKILEWLGRGTRQRDKPLLGLTATPMRGRRESDETASLLKRFDDNLLDSGVFGADIPQVRLQRDQVLARAELEILSGSDIQLSAAEMTEFKEKKWMPKAAERRLGRDEDRTRKLVNSILSKPADWPILVFAASVENAQTLATLLTLSGRSAASIDQDTSPDDRRLAIERFKSGDLKVLTNYAVLSQGFDAPMTRAVYITRPTSSEVRYLQMIGRGLRGPKNGGSDRVLIVNLMDNVMEFGDSIVFDLTEILDAEEK